MKDLELFLPDQYAVILERIDNYFELAKYDTENFNKSSSQFKTVMLDVANITPINSARHYLAVIQQVRMALEETNIKIRKKKIELSQKENELLSAQGYESDLLMIDIDEIKMHIDNMEAAGRGAVRRLAHALTQYKNILDSLGLEHLTELDFEKDEIRYHIMTAFHQALTAARSRGGVIDEGNHIYLFQLGINGAVAQHEVTAFLEAEQEAINNGVEPKHEDVMRWLHDITNKFETYPEKFANNRFMPVLDKSILVSLENK